MSARIKKHWAYIHLLAKTPSAQQRKALLETITPEQFKAVSEVILNVVHLKVPIPKAAVARLKRHKAIIGLLADRKVSARRRLEVLANNLNLVVKILNTALPGLQTLLS